MQQSIAPSRALATALWILRIPTAAFFLFAAMMKLSGQPMMVADFEQIGLGQWFRYVTATVEVAGGLTLLLPRFSFWGAAVLLCVDLGAFVVQLSSLHKGWLHTIVLAMPLLLLCWLQRGALGNGQDHLPASGNNR